MIPVILLAGGKASRMGTPKTLVTGRGFRGYWLEEQLRRLDLLGLRTRTVVLGFHAERELAALEGIEAVLLVNPRPELGPFSSLVTGLRSVSIKNGVFVLPIDVPAPPGKVWSNLSTALAQVAVPTHLGRAGHPVLLGHEFIKTICNIPLNSLSARLDHQISQLPETAVARIHCEDSEVLMNLNSPADWMAFEGTDCLMDV